MSITASEMAGALSSALKAQAYKVDIEPLNINATDKFEMTKIYKKWMTHYKRLAKPFEKRTPEDREPCLFPP